MKSASIKHFIIIGKANAGKTLFLLNFAEYMGYSNLTIKFKNVIEENTTSNNICDYKKKIVGDMQNTTRCLQIANIDIPVFKGKKNAEFIDTTGLSSNIHFDQGVREGMVQTLSLLKEDYVIFHMIDGPSIAQDGKIDDIDIEIYRYGSKRGSYLMLINKMDLEEYNQGFQIISKALLNARIIKISALYKTGFAEVKRYVSKFI